MPEEVINLWKKFVSVKPILKSRSSFWAPGSRGGWLWGGADDRESVKTILRALELGINFIDTAPVYGFGKSESVIGMALKEWGSRDGIVLATKCGLEWDERENVQRNSSPERIEYEVDQSLKRLGVDCIDLVQIHWPDSRTPFESSIRALQKLQEAGKIRYYGLSNFGKDQVAACLKAGPVYSLQPPYNIFEREVEKELLPFCVENGIATLGYGGLCRGLLTGKFKGDEEFPKGDLRRFDPKFKPDRFKQYVKAVEALKKLAASYGKTVAQFALRWAVQQPGLTTPLPEREPCSKWRTTQESPAGRFAPKTWQKWTKSSRSTSRRPSAPNSWHHGREKHGSMKGEFGTLKNADRRRLTLMKVRTGGLSSEKPASPPLHYMRASATMMGSPPCRMVQKRMEGSPRMTERERSGTSMATFHPVKALRR